MLQGRRSQAQVPMRWIFFSIFSISFQLHHGPEVASASNRREYKEYSWAVKGS
jgi:hypothetical protein